MIRRNFFLRKKYVVSLLILIFLSWIIVISPYHLVPISFALFVLYLFRRKSLNWKENLKSDGTIFLSPVGGEVVSIGEIYNEEENLYYTEIRIVSKFLDYWGLHLPFSAEMEYLKSQKGKSLARTTLEDFKSNEAESFAKTDLTLRSREGHRAKISFLHCWLGKPPKLWMKSGDRGKGAACFGYYPFGGSLIIYIPKPCDILIIKGEQLVPAQTVLAVTKEREEV